MSLLQRLTEVSITTGPHDKSYGAWPSRQEPARRNSELYGLTRLAVREPVYRNRRSAQRRQVHPVQRADQGRGARRELPVRHDRAERRRGRRARPAARRAGEAVQARRGSCPPRCGSPTSPGWSRAPREGQGLGNQFLGHIRETDAICQVVRVFRDPDVTRVEGSAEPEGDIETVVTELILADLQTLEKATAPAGEGDEVRQGPGEARDGGGGPGGGGGARLGQDAVRRGGAARGSRSPALRELHLLTAKPFLYVFNMDVGELSDEGLKKQLTDAGGAGRGDLPRREDRGRPGRAAPTRRRPSCWRRRASASQAWPSSPRRASAPSACRPS